MEKLALIVKNITHNDIGLAATYCFNKISQEKPKIGLYAFYREYGRQIIPINFCMSQDSAAWHFDGVCIATDLRSANRLINCIHPTERYFYIWDLEWLYFNHNIDYYASIYMNDNLELIARSQEHADIISQCWRKPKFVIEDFNYEQTAEQLKL